MMTLPDHLQKNEREAIVQLANALTEKLEDNLIALYLFGSKARHDFRDGSDIDLLVIVRDLNVDSRWLIRVTAADYSLEYDVLFNTHIYEQQRWNAIVAQEELLWQEVQRDGIWLATSTSQPSN